MISKTGLIFLALTMLIIQPTMAEPKKPEWRSPEVEKIVKAKRQAILEEIKTLENHDWAGSYYQGDGLGSNITFEIAPKSGFVFEEHGCLGLYDRNYGKVKLKDGRIQLQYMQKVEGDEFRWLTSTLIPISWGKRRYLVPENRIVEFINKVNQGRMVKNKVLGWFLIHRGNDSTIVGGFPEIPEKYRQYLLPRPILATVLSVESSIGTLLRSEKKRKEFTVTIDAGEKQGVWVGMEFFVTGQRRFQGGAFRITKVDDNRSEGIVELIIEGRPGPEVGWQLSTLAP